LRRQASYRHQAAEPYDPHVLRRMARDAITAHGFRSTP
jgi:hypothetical protein